MFRLLFYVICSSVFEPQFIYVFLHSADALTIQDCQDAYGGFRHWLGLYRRSWDAEDMEGDVWQLHGRSFARCSMYEAMAFKSICERFHYLLYTDFLQIYDQCEPKFGGSSGGPCSADKLWERLWVENWGNSNKHKNSRLRFIGKPTCVDGEHVADSLSNLDTVGRVGSTTSVSESTITPIDLSPMGHLINASFVPDPERIVLDLDRLQVLYRISDNPDAINVDRGEEIEAAKSGELKIDYTREPDHIRLDNAILPFPFYLPENCTYGIHETFEKQLPLHLIREVMKSMLNWGNKLSQQVQGETKENMLLKSSDSDSFSHFNFNMRTEIANNLMANQHEIKNHGKGERNYDTINSTRGSLKLNHTQIWDPTKELGDIFQIPKRIVVTSPGLADPLADDSADGLNDYRGIDLPDDTEAKYSDLHDESDLNDARPWDLLNITKKSFFYLRHSAKLVQYGEEMRDRLTEIMGNDELRLLAEKIANINSARSGSDLPELPMPYESLVGNNYLTPQNMDVLFGLAETFIKARRHYESVVIYRMNKNILASIKSNNSMSNEKSYSTEIKEDPSERNVEHTVVENDPTLRYDSSLRYERIASAISRLRTQAPVGVDTKVRDALRLQLLGSQTSLKSYSPLYGVMKDPILGSMGVDVDGYLNVDDIWKIFCNQFLALWDKLSDGMEVRHHAERKFGYLIVNPEVSHQTLILPKHIPHSLPKHIITENITETTRMFHTGNSYIHDWYTKNPRKSGDWYGDWRPHHKSSIHKGILKKNRKSSMVIPKILSWRKDRVENDFADGIVNADITTHDRFDTDTLETSPRLDTIPWLTSESLIPKTRNPIDNSELHSISRMVGRVFEIFDYPGDGKVSAGLRGNDMAADVFCKLTQKTVAQKRESYGKLRARLKGEILDLYTVIVESLLDDITASLERILFNVLPKVGVPPEESLEPGLSEPATIISNLRTWIVDKWTELREIPLYGDSVTRLLNGESLTFSGQSQSLAKAVNKLAAGVQTLDADSFLDTLQEVLHDTLFEDLIVQNKYLGFVNSDPKNQRSSGVAYTASMLAGSEGEGASTELPDFESAIAADVRLEAMEVLRKTRKMKAHKELTPLDGTPDLESEFHLPRSPTSYADAPSVLEQFAILFENIVNLLRPILEEFVHLGFLAQAFLPLLQVSLAKISEQIGENIVLNNGDTSIKSPYALLNHLSVILQFFLKNFRKISYDIVIRKFRNAFLVNKILETEATTLRVAEIGVFKGVTTFQILRDCQLPGWMRFQYHLVDPWLDDMSEMKLMKEVTFSDQETSDFIMQQVLQELNKIAREGEEVKKLKTLREGDPIGELQQHEQLNQSHPKTTKDSRSPSLHYLSIPRIADLPYYIMLHARIAWNNTIQEPILVQENHRVHRNRVGVFIHKTNSIKAGLSMDDLDVAFIDGDHSLAGFLQDLWTYAGRTQYYLSGHDFNPYTFPGIPTALIHSRTPGTRTFNSFGHLYRRSKIILEADYCWWMKRSD